MPLDRATLADHLMERIYDVLCNREILDMAIDEVRFKDILRQDVLIQLSIIENELYPEKK